MRPGPSLEIIQRIESIEGSAIAEILNRFYLREKFSYRQLCRRWAINNRTLRRLLSYFEIRPRKGGDAIRAQWLHAPSERRMKAAEMMRTMSSAMAREGRHPRLNKTKDLDHGTMQAAQKLKKATSARRLSVRAKNAEAHRCLIRRNPPGHATSKRTPTKAEFLILEHLNYLGLKPIFNHIVMPDIGPRWINIFIPALNLAVECEHLSRFPLDWVRHEKISSLGIRIVYITNKRIHRGIFGGLDKYIACLQLLRPHPAAHGQNTVVWGRINKTVVKNQPEQIAVEPISVDRGYSLLLTTTPDDPILNAYRFNRLPS